MANISLVGETNLPLKLKSRGKVRDIYELDEDKLLMVVSDRISAFDVILPNLIPHKGEVLSQLSIFWFQKTKRIIENHLISTDFEKFVPELKNYPYLKKRSFVVKRAKVIPVECIVRGYLCGSAWSAYKGGRTICGINLPPGLKEGEKLSQPLFTPTTKVARGHDEEITEIDFYNLVGKSVAQKIKKISLKLYQFALKFAQKRGVIIADTKFEFGFWGKKLILIDELLTPDSSRFWFKEDYKPGRPQESFDKQFVRDYLLKINWDKKPPAPSLPEEVIKETSQKYIKIYQRITGGDI